MRIVTLDQVQKDLQNLADQVGEKGFVNAKALYMEKVAVVDEEGTPLTADEIEVVLMPKPADNQQDMMEDDEEEKSAEVAAPAPKAAPAPRRKAASVAARMSAPAIARPKVWGSLKNFKSDDRGDAVDKALRFGHWLLASKWQPQEPFVLRSSRHPGQGSHRGCELGRWLPRPRRVRDRADLAS
jgi:hypothetical protein